MNIKHTGFTPVLIGAIMGLMLLWMLHGALTGTSNSAGPALVLFIGLHLLAVAGIGLAALGLTRFFPRVRTRLQRLHRPNLLHFLWMLAGAALTAGLAHIVIHGVLP